MSAHDPVQRTPDAGVGAAVARLTRHPGVIFDCCAILLALALSLWHPQAQWIERYYTNDFYLPLDRAVRPVIDAYPFSVADLLLLGVIAGLAVWWYRFCRRSGMSRPRRVGRALLRTVAVFALIFVWFEAGWALNYDRVPVADKLVLRSGPDDMAAMNAYADHVIRMLNANAVAAHAEHLTPDQVHALIAPTFYRTVRLLGDDSVIAVPRVKPTLFDPVFRYMGESGLMDPWTHEVNLYSGMFFYEWPAIYAHEWSHASGFANESEANYIATLSCINSSSPLLRYSGWLLVWESMPPGIHITQHAVKQVVDDTRAIQARYERETNHAASEAAEAAYDRYLKANRVRAGVQSYELFIRWLIDGSYGPDGFPRVHSS